MLPQCRFTSQVPVHAELGSPPHRCFRGSLAKKHLQLRGRVAL